MLSHPYISKKGAKAIRTERTGNTLVFRPGVAVRHHPLRRERIRRHDRRQDLRRRDPQRRLRRVHRWSSPSRPSPASSMAASAGKGWCLSIRHKETRLARAGRPPPPDRVLPGIECRRVAPDVRRPRRTPGDWQACRWVIAHTSRCPHRPYLAPSQASKIVPDHPRSTCS
jgi:hypothetical protein